MSPVDRLTQREREVVRALRQGRPYKAIAHELGIQASTARVLGSRALRKLNTVRIRERVRAKGL